MQKKDQVNFWNYPLNFCFKKEPERLKMPIRSGGHLGPGCTDSLEPFVLSGGERHEFDLNPSKFTGPIQEV